MLKLMTNNLIDERRVKEDREIMSSGDENSISLQPLGLGLELSGWACSRSSLIKDLTLFRWMTKNWRSAAPRHTHILIFFMIF